MKARSEVYELNRCAPGLAQISSYPRSLWYRVLEWSIPTYENIYCIKSQSRCAPHTILSKIEARQRVKEKTIRELAFPSAKFL